MYYMSRLFNTTRKKNRILIFILLKRLNFIFFKKKFKFIY